MRVLYLLMLVLTMSAAVSRAQLTVAVGPRGEVREVRAGDVTYLTDLAVAVIRPGWTGSVADQREADARTVRVENRAGKTVYSIELGADGGRLDLHETVELGARRAAVRYELTPSRDIPVECVLLQGLLPTAAHAGKTRYVVADGLGTHGTCPAALDAGSYVLVGGRAADWMAFSNPGGQALRVTPMGLDLQFQDNRKWGTPAFGLLATTGTGALRAGKTYRFGLTFEAQAPSTFEEETRMLQSEEPARLKLGDDRPLRIGSVTLDRARLPALEMVEATIDVAARYANPFDPGQIAVDGLVTCPNGKVVSVPAFFYYPMKLRMRNGAEQVLAAGRPSFRLRYTPTLPGKYTVVVRASDRSGTVKARPVTFTATAGQGPGFIRVARAAPHMFAHDDGSPYFAVGENVCWSGPRSPIADYAAWFGKLGAAGGNWARLWLAYNEKGLEWTAAPTPRAGYGGYLGLGRYAQDNSWRLDEIVRLARQNGIRVMFCLGTYGEFTEGGYFNEGMWVSNPYNARNGGPCASPADFWTNPEARRLYKQRLRYLIARWGYSPNLFAWEFWNEVPASPAVNRWVAEMAAYLKQNDPNHHLVSTTYGDAATWRCPDIDFTMKHMYGQAGNVADFTSRIVAEAREGRSYGKPYLLAEFGIDWQTDDGKWDPKGLGTNMHNGAWASLMAGSAGTSMLWYWDGYVHPKNVYHVLTAVRKFAGTVDWARTPLRPIEGLSVTTDARAPETFSDVTIPADVEWGRPPSDRYTVLRDASVAGGPIAMTIGSPSRGNPNELYTRLTWELDMPAAGKVVVHLGQVCSRAHPVFAVDGVVQYDKELAAGEPGKGPWKSARYLEQYRIWVSDYDEDIPLEVPAGRHSITLANADGDWFQVRSITIPGYRSSRYPAVDALGLAGKRLLLLWIHNRESTWRTAYDGKTPATIRGLRLRVPIEGTGRWRVEWWDTATGSVIRRDIATASQRALTLHPPDFATDLAARCERAP